MSTILRTLRQRRGLEWITLGGTSAIIVWLGIVPIAYLLWGTFFPNNRLSFEAFRRVGAGHGFGDLVWNSLIFSVGTTAVSLVVGTLLALAIERTDVPLRRLLLLGAMAPLFIPTMLYAVSWVFLASPRTGVLNVLLGWLPGSPNFDVFSMAGMVLVQGLDSVPLVVLLMMVAFRSSDPSLEEAGMMSGGNRIQVIRKVTLPIAMPAFFVAGMLTLIRSIEAFEVPAILGIGGHRWVLTTRIWRVMENTPPDYGQAGVLGVILLAFTGVTVYIHQRMTRQGRSYQSISGKAFRPGRLPLGKWRMPVGILALGYILISVVMPLGIMVYASTQPLFMPPTASRIANASLDQYRALLSDSKIAHTFWNSIILGVLTATVLMVLTALAAWIVLRTRIRGRGLLDFVTLVPLAVPGLVLGVAIVFVYLRSPIPVYGTLWILAIAYLTKFLPYAMRYSAASLVKIGSELEESARMSGAGFGAMFRRIILPLLMPGFIAGWLYVFMMSIRELSASLLLYSPGKEVLAIQIWEFWQDGVITRLAALGVIMIGLVVVVAAIAARIGNRLGVSYDG